LLGLLFAAGIPAFPQSPPRWIEPGKGVTLPAEFEFPDDRGELGIVNASGPVNTQGHPFFDPLGANGRACVTCHQPAYAMTISATAVRERWKATQGKDPLFAAVDGSNCPDLPQEKESSHSLLLDRGLIRLAIPWPPANAKPEFSVEMVNDPTGCNTSATYGLHGVHPAVSVFRRPRMAANLKYATNPTPQFAVVVQFESRCQRLLFLLFEQADDLFDGPNVIGDSSSHGRRRAERHMFALKVIGHRVERDRRSVILKLL
jgi:hypothetical protein